MMKNRMNMLNLRLVMIILAFQYFLFGIPCAATCQAQEQKDSVFLKLYQHYFQLFNDGSNEKEFWKASEQLKDYLLQHDKKDSYYKIRQNDVFYEIDHDRSYRALKIANDIMEEMKADNRKHYDIVYTSLGTIYESRGNYRMAKHYYLEALKDTHPDDSLALVGNYTRIASLEAPREPEEAWKWNEKAGAIAKKHPDYYKAYLANQGKICFFMNDKEQFRKAYQEFKDVIRQQPVTDNYGAAMMETLNLAMEGQEEKALEQLKHSIPDVDELTRLNMRSKIYETTGRYDIALKETALRRDLRDSLNSDLLFNNLNEVNAELGLFKVGEKAAKERERWLAAIIVLLVIALALIIWRHLTRRRYRRKLQKQNKELEIALSRAEESDRMKDSFIEHVSHEIRTPLNVITGYAQIISNPRYKLTDEQRSRFIDDISKNTTKITDIVNELLEVAQDESREYYQKDDVIVVNSFCRQLLEEAELSNKQHLELLFDTALNDSYTLNSNRRVLMKLLQQLLNNAMKFTKKGRVELKVHDSPDHGVLRFIVMDTGIGIAEEHREKIFERFFKVDPFMQGFGLGLTMSRKMATLLGGSLELDTTYTQGASFILTLPVHSA